MGDDLCSLSRERRQRAADEEADEYNAEPAGFCAAILLARLDRSSSRELCVYLHENSFAFAEEGKDATVKAS
jgi:hypothetical protein